MLLLPNGVSDSGLACKQKEDILNIFFNSIRKQKATEKFLHKNIKDNLM